MASAAAAASAAAPYVMYKLSSSALAAVLARNLWKSLPAWIRDDPALAKRGSLLRGGSAGNNNDGTIDADADLLNNPDETEEMATLSDVIARLDNMVTSAGKTIGTKLKPAQIHAAILAYVQLSNQLRVNFPEARDRLYEKCAFHRHDDAVRGDDDSDSPSSHVTRDELRVLRQSLDFATWSYVDYYGPDEVRAKLESVDGDYYLHSHSTHEDSVPGKVGHFIALSPERKEIVIGVKGTSSLEDLVTDAAGTSTPFDMHAAGGGGGNSPSPCGDGHCERMSIEVAVDQETIVVDFAQDLSRSTVSNDCLDATTETGEAIEVELRVEKESIVILPDGSNVWCHEGVLLSARRLLCDVREVVETLAVKSGYSVRIVGHSLGGGVAILLGILIRSKFPSLAERNAVRVHAFAPPPVLDIDGATGCEFFVTSVINNSDVIPRGSVGNLAVLMELLRVINDKLEAMGMGLGGPKRAAALLRKLSQGAGGEMIMTWQEVRDLIEESHRKVDLRDAQHLYVGGRILFIFDSWKDQATRSVLTHGHAAPLRLFEVDALRMFTDHLTTSHEARLDRLLLGS